MRVLVATEDPAERDLIAEALSARRDVSKVLVPRDGVEAYLAIRQHTPDLAIVSARLDRIDGIVLVRTLVRSPTFRSRTILILDQRCHERVREALDARPSGIIVRPFDAVTFIDRVGLVLALEAPAPRSVAAVAKI